MSGSNLLPLLLQKDGTGQLPIHLAAYKGHAKMVSVLLQPLTPDEKCSMLMVRTPQDELDVENSGKTALHYAIRKGGKSMVTAMLDSLSNEQRKEVTAVKDNRGHTVIESAEKRNDGEVVRALKMSAEESNAGA